MKGYPAVAASKRILMIVPVPVPDIALPSFAAQIPLELVRPDIGIDFIGCRNGAKLLDSPYEQTLADAWVLEAGARAEEDGYAAVCVNSMSDSGLAALRSRLTIPVVGPGRASFFLAADLGKKFSVLTMWKRWHPLYEKLALETGLSSRLASIRDIDTRPDTAELLAGKEDIVFAKLEEQARRAIDEDGADVIILGSTTMHQSATWLASRLEVPVLNPGLVAFKLCETLIDLGLAHSKKTYFAPEMAQDDLLNPVSTLFG
jgi:allantoin racemase